MISEFPHFLDTMIPNFHIFLKVFCMTWSHRPWSSGRAPNLCHRRIQGAGVLSVIERSGGLFGQVLKMEETPKWHKMTIKNPKKNRNTFFTNLHYLCWDLPFLFFWGMTAAAVRSSLWPGYSAGPTGEFGIGKIMGKPTNFPHPKYRGLSEWGIPTTRMVWFWMFFGYSYLGKPPKRAWGNRFFLFLAKALNSWQLGLGNFW